MASNIEQYVKQASNGDQQALETVIDHIQGNIYGLALRMLNDAQDAEDEAQEILIKVITHLSGFRGESAFSSWVYRIACNHLLTERTRKNEHTRLTFGLLEEMTSEHVWGNHTLTISGPEREVLLEEVRLYCMQGLLSCLEKEMRIIVILGEQYGVTGQEGAFILNITPETFRKRLSRGRKLLQDYMSKQCGLVNKKITCRCHKNAAEFLENNEAIPGVQPTLIKEVAVKNRAKLVAGLNDLSEIDRTVEMYRNYPKYQTPDSFKYIVRDLIGSGRYSIFE